jgi:hypothetical protein
MTGRWKGKGALRLSASGPRKARIVHETECNTHALAGTAFACDARSAMSGDDPDCRAWTRPAFPWSVSCTVAHFTTFDLYGRWDATEHLNLHGSVLNATNTHIPYDWATYAAPNVWLPWNPSLHQQGAIGPFFTLGVTYTF